MATDQGAAVKDTDWQDYQPAKKPAEAEGWQDYEPATTSQSSTLPTGSYQARKGGPILNANDSLFHTTVRGVESSAGMLGEHGESPETQGQAWGNAARSLGRFGLATLKDPFTLLHGPATAVEESAKDIEAGLPRMGGINPGGHPGGGINWQSLGYGGGAALGNRASTEAIGRPIDATLTKVVPPVVGFVGDKVGAAIDPARSVAGETRAQLGRVVRDPLTGKVRSPYQLAVEKILPDPDAAARAEAQARPINERMTEKQHAEFEKQQSEIEAARQKELADMERLKEQDAQARMRRGVQQSRLDTAHEQRLKEIEDARQRELAANERFKEQHARSLMGREEAPAPRPWGGSSSRGSFPEPKIDSSGLGDPGSSAAPSTPKVNLTTKTQAAREAEAIGSKIVGPSAGEPRISGSEGRPATWTNERVMELAKQGNRDAIAQAVRRGMELPPNTRYVMGDPDYPRAVYNSKEVTRSAPENMPIRNAANPTVKSPRVGIQTPPAESMPKEVINAETGEIKNPRESVGTPLSPVEQPRAGVSPSPLGERRATPRATALNSAPVDPIREARMAELRGIVRDKTVDIRDRAIAQSQLDDMEANPGERNQLGDLKSMKAQPKRMTREEAEAATEARKAGRNKRFNQR